MASRFFYRRRRPYTVRWLHVFSTEGDVLTPFAEEDFTEEGCFEEDIIKF